MQNNLKSYRKLLKLRQEDLALKLGVCRQTVIALEESQHDCSLKVAFKLAKIFNCKIEDLFFE